MSETRTTAHRAPTTSTRSTAHDHGGHDTAGMSHRQAQMHNLQRIIGNQAIQRQAVPEEVPTPAAPAAVPAPPTPKKKDETA